MSTPDTSALAAELEHLGGLARLVEVAETAARRGGDVLVHHFERRDQLVVEEKSRNDFVSRADRESEQAVVEVLEAELGHDVGCILGEEGGERGEGDLHWILDPLDGTTNFLEGLPIWCVSVAALWRGELAVGVVYEPLRDVCFAAAAGQGGVQKTPRGTTKLQISDTAPDKAFLSTGFPFRAHAAVDEFLALFRIALLGSKAIRRCGAAALDLANVASGVYDGFFELRLSPWDVAAAGLLIQEAGGVVTDFDGGQDWLRSGNILAGNPEVQAQLLEWTRRVTSERRVEELVPL